MNVTQDLSILHLILEASAVVQIVMALLAAVSCMSWYYIFMKWFSVRQARAKTETFERDFWSGGDLNSLFNSAVNDRHHAGSMERIFEAGFREFTKLKGREQRAMLKQHAHAVGGTPFSQLGRRLAQHLNVAA